MVSRGHQPGRGGAGAQEPLRGQLPPPGQPGDSQDSLGGRPQQDRVQPRHQVSSSKYYILYRIISDLSSLLKFIKVL